MNKKCSDPHCIGVHTTIVYDEIDGSAKTVVKACPGIVKPSCMWCGGKGYTPGVNAFVIDRCGQCDGAGIIPYDFGCGQCYECLNKPELGFNNPVGLRMILCPLCGNKRCPKSTDHTLDCSGSNELGQQGSRY